MWRNSIRNLLVALTLIVGWSLPASAAAKFLVLCTTACAWNNTNDAIWSTSSGGINNTTHPVAGDAVTLDANSCVGGLTCTITGGAVTIAATSITMGACTASTTGCILDFSANNTNLTLTGGLSVTGTGTRTFNCGSGTFTSSAVATVFDATTTTNLTLSCASVTLTFTGTGNTRTFVGGANSFGTINIGSANTYFTISTGANTFANFNVTGPNMIRFNQGVTTTITNPPTITSSGSAPVIFESSTAGTVTTIAFTGGATIQFMGFQDITCTGSPTATNSFNFANNTNCGITGPSGSGGRIIGG